MWYYSIIMRDKRLNSSTINAISDRRWKGPLVKAGVRQHFWVLSLKISEENEITPTWKHTANYMYKKQSSSDWNVTHTALIST